MIYLLDNYIAAQFYCIKHLYNVLLIPPSLSYISFPLFSPAPSKDLEKTRESAIWMHIWWENFPKEKTASSNSWRRAWYGWAGLSKDKGGKDEMRDQLDLCKPCEGFGFYSWVRRKATGGCWSGLAFNFKRSTQAAILRIYYEQQRRKGARGRANWNNMGEGWWWF